MICKYYNMEIQPSTILSKEEKLKLQTQSASKTYYYKNKERISETRKNKYNSNDDYRRNQLYSSRVRGDKLKVERKEKRENKEPTPKFFCETCKQTLNLNNKRRHETGKVHIMKQNKSEFKSDGISKAFQNSA